MLLPLPIAHPTLRGLGQRQQAIHPWEEEDRLIPGKNGSVKAGSGFCDYGEAF